jgi:tRNA A-37 threonylcarbamoyl transferase component Bud32
LFDAIMASYKLQMKGSKDCVEIVRKLDEVRMRGRKRTMVG